MSTDIDMTRGDSATFDLTLLEPDNSPMNLTGCGLRFTAKYDVYDDDGAAVFSVTNEVGGAITVAFPLTGEAVIQLSPANTASMQQAARLYYDVQVKKVNGSIYTVASGRLNVKADVTRTNA